MGDLFWPGEERAGSLLSGAALLEAMVAVEDAWLAGLVETGIAPESAAQPLGGLVGEGDVNAVAAGAEASGNPVIGLVELLRRRMPETPARWLHRGLTSQDVLDTALALCLRAVADRLGAEVAGQVETLVDLAEEHEDSVMVGRTLTQHAVPITFGLKAAVWLTGVLDAADLLTRARAGLGVDVGGAAGTLAAAVELARLTGRFDPVATVQRLVRIAAGRLDLPVRAPWHTTRSPFTTFADALVGCSDAYGHIAADVTTLSRPEIAELAEGIGGGSSTMPHKRNPALAVLIRRAALTAPGLAATAHLAAATAVDERPDGAWHVEWATLRDLGRRTVVAASQTTDLLTGLRVDTEAMAAAVSASAGLDAEQLSMADVVGVEPSDSYLGSTEQLIADAVRRGRSWLVDEHSPGKRSTEKHSPGKRSTEFEEGS